MNLDDYNSYNNVTKSDKCIQINNNYLVKRNEAICCLIGFGIGIGCCLVYRWLKNNLFFTNQQQQNTSSNKYWQQTNSFNKSNYFASSKKLFNNDCNQSTSSSSNKSRIKAKLKLNKSTKHSNRSSLSHSNSNNSITTNYTSSCCCCCCCCSSNNKNDNFSRKLSNSNQQQHQPPRQHHEQSQSLPPQRYQSNYDFNEPLNDVYMNLTKFLNKQFCRNIKLRRPVGATNVNNNNNSKNSTKHSSKLNSNASLSSNQNSTLINNTSGSELPCSNRQSNTSLHSTSLLTADTITKIPNDSDTIINENKQQRQIKRVSMNQSLDKYLDLKYEITSCMSTTASSSSLLSTAINYSSTNNPNDKLENENNNTSDPLIDSFNTNKSHLSSLSSYYENNNYAINASANNFGHNSDEISFELFANSSHRSSLFDFDDISESKYANPKSDNLVDQSLDEALNQINKLKEDMNNLCEDIDSLYNTKSTMRLNYLGEEDEYDSIELNHNNHNNNNGEEALEEDDEENMYFKCDCVYSNCSLQATKLNSCSYKSNLPNFISNEKFVSNKKFKITHNNKALLSSTQSAALLLSKTNRKHICYFKHNKSFKKFCL